jgi:hypothetical protein
MNGICEPGCIYLRATEAPQLLERLYETPQRDCMPCLLIHGDSDIGKTTTTAKVKRAHPGEFDESSGVGTMFSRYDADAPDT